MHHAGADLARHVAGLIDVARRDVARKAIGGVVGDRDGLLFAVVGHDRQHRSENLLARDRHVVAHVGEHVGRM